MPCDALVVNLDYDVLLHSSSFPQYPSLPDCRGSLSCSPPDLTAPVLASFQTIRQPLLSHTHTQQAAKWKERWSCPDPDHLLPKLNKQDSTVLFSAVLDLYGHIVSGYGFRLRARASGNYAGCTLRDMFEVDGFVKGASRSLQPFLREFVATQLFSNLIRSRIESSCMPQTSSLNLLDFPVLFFDKYLTLMKHPAKTRVSHLYRVLYQRSNRILLLSISLGSKESLRTSYVLSASVSSEVDCSGQSHIAALLNAVQTTCPSIQLCGDVVNTKESIQLCGDVVDTKDSIALAAERKLLPEELQFCSCSAWCSSCQCSVDLAVVDGERNNTQSSFASLHFTCPYCSASVTPRILTPPSLFHSEPVAVTHPTCLASCSNPLQLRASVLLALSCALPCFDEWNGQSVVSLPFRLYSLWRHMRSEASSQTSVFRCLVRALWRARGMKLCEEEETEVSFCAEELLLQLFCVGEKDGTMIGMEDGVRKVLQEIVRYMREGDVENAVKLFLFCRGGEVHAGFEKCELLHAIILRPMFPFLFHCFLFYNAQWNDIHDRATGFVNDYTNVCYVWTST